MDDRPMHMGEEHQGSARHPPATSTRYEPAQQASLFSPSGPGGIPNRGFQNQPMGIGEGPSAHEFAYAADLASDVGQDQNKINREPASQASWITNPMSEAEADISGLHPNFCALDYSKPTTREFLNKNYTSQDVRSALPPSDYGSYKGSSNESPHGTRYEAFRREEKQPHTEPSATNAPASNPPTVPGGMSQEDVHRLISSRQFQNMGPNHWGPTFMDDQEAFFAAPPQPWQTPDCQGVSLESWKAGLPTAAYKYEPIPGIYKRYGVPSPPPLFVVPLSSFSLSPEQPSASPTSHSLEDRPTQPTLSVSIPALKTTIQPGPQSAPLPPTTTGAEPLGMQSRRHGGLTPYPINPTSSLTWGPGTQRPSLAAEVQPPMHPRTDSNVSSSSSSTLTGSGSALGMMIGSTADGTPHKPLGARPPAPNRQATMVARALQDQEQQVPSATEAPRLFTPQAGPFTPQRQQLGFNPAASPFRPSSVLGPFTPARPSSGGSAGSTGSHMAVVGSTSRSTDGSAALRSLGAMSGDPRTPHRKPSSANLHTQYLGTPSRQDQIWTAERHRLLALLREQQQGRDEAEAAAAAATGPQQARSATAFVPTTDPARTPTPSSVRMTANANRMMSSPSPLVTPGPRRSIYEAFPGALGGPSTAETPMGTSRYTRLSRPAAMLARDESTCQYGSDAYGSGTNESDAHGSGAYGSGTNGGDVHGSNARGSSAQAGGVYGTAPGHQARRSREVLIDALYSTMSEGDEHKKRS